MPEEPPELTEVFWLRFPRGLAAVGTVGTHISARLIFGSHGRQASRHPLARNNRLAKVSCIIPSFAPSQHTHGLERDTRCPGALASMAARRGQRGSMSRERGLHASHSCRAALPYRPDTRLLTTALFYRDAWQTDWCSRANGRCDLLTMTKGNCDEHSCTIWSGQRLGLVNKPLG